MNLGQVSIIIPVYNVEEYIAECLESVIKQTYLNLQIILIDDGSSDSSGDICDKYSQKDKRILVLHTMNSGPAAARNYGIKVAIGEYIVFIDSDDTIAKQYIQCLIDGINQGKDLFCTAYIDKSIYGIVKCNDFSVKKYTRETLINCVISGTGGVLWGKIFRNDLIHKYNLFLPEELYMCEDMIFILNYIKYIKRWSAISRPLYYYNRLNAKSISSKIGPSYIENYLTFYRYFSMSLKELGLSKKEIDAIIEQKTISLIEYLIMETDNLKETYKVIYEKEKLYKCIENYVNIPIEIRLLKKRRFIILELLIKFRKMAQTIKRRFRKIRGLCS